MSATHTPGPWLIDPGEGPSGDGYNEPREPGIPPFIYVDHEDQVVMIASMYEPEFSVPLPDNPNDDPYNCGVDYIGDLGANARLIASAPDLLEAWKLFFGAKEKIDQGLTSYADQRAEALEMAKAAIAKAEDRS